MADPKLPQRNSSRTIAIVVVVVLIVVAIAGIVLAPRKAPPGDAGAPSATTPPAASAPTAVASGPADPPPTDVVFAAGSDKLPPKASEGLARFSDMVRVNGSNVRLSARFLTGANKAKDFELAKARTTAIRHALEANGIKAQHLQTELIEMPAGALKPGDGDRVELILR